MSEAVHTAHCVTILRVGEGHDTARGTIGSSTVVHAVRCFDRQGQGSSLATIPVGLCQYFDS
jgi:hypothetical protein